MLPKLVLILLQGLVAWTFAPQARALIPVNVGAFNILLLAVIVAVIVWLVGHIGALVLKDTPPPSSATLTACVVLALIFAGLTLVPQVMTVVNGTLRLSLPVVAFPLIGAILGYLAKR
jgi:hypothetical protein